MNIHDLIEKGFHITDSVVELMFDSASKTYYVVNNNDEELYKGKDESKACEAMIMNRQPTSDTKGELIDQATEIEWLRWFYKNVPLGLDEEALKDLKKAHFVTIFNKKLPEGYEIPYYPEDLKTFLGEDKP